MYSGYGSNNLYGGTLAHSPIMGTETLTEAGSLFSQSELTALDGFFDSQLGPEEPLLPLQPQQPAYTSPSRSNYGAQALPYSAWPQPSAFVAPSYPSSLVYNRDAWRNSQPAIDAQSMSGVSYKDSASISMSASHPVQSIQHQPFQTSQDEKLRSQADELARWLQMRSGAVSSSNASSQMATPQTRPQNQQLSQAQPVANSTSQADVAGPASNSSASDFSLPTPTSAHMKLSVPKTKPELAANTIWDQSRRSSAIDPSHLALEASTSTTQSQQTHNSSSTNSLQHIEADEERSYKRPRNEIETPIASRQAPVALPRGAKARRASSSARQRLPVAANKANLPPLVQDDSDEGKPSMSSVQPNGNVPLASGKAMPLTEEQKRANHIMSEQRRRTAIRAAYDELCNVVPALRAAVEEYEERLQRVAGDKAATSGEGGVAGVLTGGIEVGGEKIDGRAGPKSEAVVLAKSGCMSM